MAHIHSYHAAISWTGETRDYNSYSREYSVAVPGKPTYRGSADAAFKGDPKLHNPEDLLLISLSTCHMLSYLAVCARLGVVVTAYEDRAEGTMAIKDKRMRFTEVVLRPRVTITQELDEMRAMAAHEQAHDECFIANSVNFPVRHEATIVSPDDQAA
ncbi:MAG TPA: OsmC family protein [Stellaceae bacterium]|jgi:organic hydroperoxide reductase OsmC/OhrA|nr:OsmC family protein [Stellaceae bacterium]